MIEDLEWRFVNNVWALYAYDGHVWFNVPFSSEEYGPDLSSLCGGCNGKGFTGNPGVTCCICRGSGKGK